MGTKAHGNVGESEFFMWRAVFAFALVDNILSMQEQELLRSYLKVAPFSFEQIAILKSDFARPQNVEAFYKKITRSQDKEKFCILARALAWCEGDMHRQEQAILKKVACFKDKPDDEVLRLTRNHPHIETYYQEYAKAGMIGLHKIPPAIQMRA